MKKKVIFAPLSAVKVFGLHQTAEWERILKKKFHLPKSVRKEKSRIVIKLNVKAFSITLKAFLIDF